MKLSYSRWRPQTDASRHKRCYNSTLFTNIKVKFSEVVAESHPYYILQKLQIIVKKSFNSASSTNSGWKIADSLHVLTNVLICCIVLISFWIKHWFMHGWNSFVSINQVMWTGSVYNNNKSIKIYNSNLVQSVWKQSFSNMTEEDTLVWCSCC